MKKLLFGALLTMCLFNACNKDTDLGIQKTAFSSNTTFTTMIQQLVSDGLYKNSDNILVFADMEAFADALDLIDTTGEIIMGRDTSVDVDDYLSAVATSFNFTSLHQLITSETQELEDADELFDYNDPDNHFIVSNYMRTFLTPYCEVVIGDVLFVFRDGFTLGVMGYDDFTLSQIRALVGSNADASSFFYLCNSNPKVYLVSPDTLTMSVDFSVNQTDFDQLEYQFTNNTGCEEYQNVSYLWDFGDGTTSTSVNPTHLYTTTGTKTVSLETTCDGVSKTCTRSVSVGKKGCWVDFNYTHNNTGVYYFTVNGYVNENDYPSYYHISFGDGTDTTIYSSSTKIDFKHTYSSSFVGQQVNLVTSFQTTNGKLSSSERCFRVSRGYCTYNCSAHTGGNSPYQHYHLYENYYVKSAIQLLNFCQIHMLHAKSIFLKKNNNGSFSRIKANKLLAGYVGTLYYGTITDNSCGIPQPRSKEKGKLNRRIVECSSGLMSTAYRVDYHSMRSYLDVTYNNHSNEYTYYATAISY